MYETQRNAGRLLLHEHPWNAWSRGLSFVIEMAEKDGVHKTTSDLCRFLSVECGNLNCDGLSGAANLANLMKLLCLVERHWRAQFYESL